MHSDWSRIASYLTRCVKFKNGCLAFCQYFQESDEFNGRKFNFKEHKHCHWLLYTYIQTYIYIYIIVGNCSKCFWKVLNTHGCRAKYSSKWHASVFHSSHFELYIYIYIYMYVWIGSLCLIFPFYSARYVELELDIYWDREKTERVYFHPYRPVSWLLSHLGKNEIKIIKSPHEWVITKQACRDESILSLFFPYLNIHQALLLRIEHCKTEKSNTDFLFIHMYGSNNDTSAVKV